jgi:ABC-type Na+ transport system ATPase subunit NatA
VLRSILFLTLDSFFFCVLIYVIDTGFFTRIRGPKLDQTSVGIDEDQRDLQEVLPPVRGGTVADRDTNAVTALDLSKRFLLEGGGSVQAVRHVSLGVAPNTILGLLGPNGAGKTTLAHMLSGLEEPDSGDAFIEQRSVVTDLDSARQRLGLCPQFDALLPNLSAREHLVMFAKVRGVPARMRARVVERTIQDMDLSLKADCRVGTYSGGNKRKLSVALSMVSDPAVAFLDEPSTGTPLSSSNLGRHWLLSRSLSAWPSDRNGPQNETQNVGLPD